MDVNAARIADEHGLALIYALFAVVVLAGLATLFVTRSVAESRFTGNNRNYETAIHIAEAGADELIATHVNDEDLDNPFVSQGPSGLHQQQNFADEDAEHAWALARAEEDSTNLISTEEGDFYGIRPLEPGASTSSYTADDVAQVVYGVGFVPSIDHPNRRERVVKLQITREFFTPDFAFLAGVDLKIGGNGKILTDSCDTAAPDPDDCDANVHANGTVTPSGNSWEVEGTVTQSDPGAMSCPSTVVGGCQSEADEEEVPPIRARDFYGRPGPYNNDPGSNTPGTVEWYDLCPDGKIYELSPSGTPCTGALYWEPGGTSTTSLGWSFSSQGGKRVWSSNAVEAGVFYVYRADAQVNGTAAGTNGSTKRAVTILLEDDDSNPEPELSGSLQMGGQPNMVAALPDVLFIADRDIHMKGTGNSGSTDNCDPNSETCDVQSYEGFISAREQIDFAGNVTLNGAALMQDEADLSQNSSPAVKRSTAGVNGNLTLNYDRTLTLALKGHVVISYWNELN